MAAKYLRCSVRAVERNFSDDDIDRACIAASADDRLREFIIKNPKK